MIKMIAAVSKNGVIGKDNALPFDYPEDLKWFRKNTVNNVVIMGRKTFEGIGKPLPKRENVVISRNKVDVPGIETHVSIEDYFRNEKLKIRDHLVEYWFVGGARIYEEGMNWAHEIYLTLTPDKIEGEGLVRFPWIDPLRFEWESATPLDQLVEMSHSSELQVLKYKRRGL